MKTLIIFSVCIGVCLAAAFVGLPDPKAVKEGKCKYNKISIKLGKHKNLGYPNECMRVSCENNGAISGMSCGVSTTKEPGCKLVKTKPKARYPECCEEKLVCK